MLCAASSSLLFQASVNIVLLFFLHSNLKFNCSMHLFCYSVLFGFNVLFQTAAIAVLFVPLSLQFAGTCYRCFAVGCEAIIRKEEVGCKGRAVCPSVNNAESKQRGWLSVGL